MKQIGYRGIYKENTKQPFRVSRSKIELFKQCQRCFWLEARLGIKRPSSAPFNINAAIDSLFKKEFDRYREKKEPHPLMFDNKVEAVPFAHEKMDEWRENFIGVQFHHEPTNLLIFGAVDDIWQSQDGKLLVVDYKATAKDREVSIDARWQIAYKRQMEVYQWLLRQNGHEVSDTGYFVYTNGILDAPSFEDHLEFKTKLIPYTGSASWVEGTLGELKETLDSSAMPPVGTAAMGGPCEHCEYAKSRTQLTLRHLGLQK